MKIKLILPAGGAPGWCEALGRALEARGHRVLRETGAAVPCVIGVRLLLWIEARVFGGPQLGRRAAAPAGRGAEQACEPVPDLVFDLTGAARERGNAPTLVFTFDGSPDPDALIGALLARRSPVMKVARAGNGAVLAASYPAIDDREVLTRALETAYARMIGLGVRAVERIGEGSPAEHWSEAAPSLPPARASSLAAARFAWRTFRIKARRQLNKRRPQPGAWRLAARKACANPATPTALSSAEFQVIASGGDTWADPFIHEQDGRAVLFAEHQPQSTGKGVIVCATLGPGGVFGPFTPCLERPYHLSYPFVFDHAGQTWMIPETSADRTLELYRAEAYPSRWVLDRVLMQDVVLADATVTWWGDRWWLFAAQSAFGGSANDELTAFHATSPMGPWSPHAMNPLKSDARSGRPAGRFIIDGGRLYRPAQDCEAEYGAGLVWCEVTTLTPTAFSERVVSRWRGADFGARGVHTFARGGGVEVIDLKGVKPR